VRPGVKRVQWIATVAVSAEQEKGVTKEQHDQVIANYY
jgi:hypothetical protein